MNLQEKLDELIEKYSSNIDDDKKKMYKDLFTLDESQDTNLVWHETHTCKEFMNVLADFNSDDGRKDNNTSKSTTSKATEVLKESVQSKKDISSKIKTLEISKPSNNEQETILSAEALKILSELPDMLPMQSKSFMFPNNR